MSLLASVNESLTVKPKLMVQASAVPLIGPLEYVSAMAGATVNPRQASVSSREAIRIFMDKATILSLIGYCTLRRNPSQHYFSCRSFRPPLVCFPATKSATATARFSNRLASLIANSLAHVNHQQPTTRRQ